MAAIAPDILRRVHLWDVRLFLRLDAAMVRSRLPAIARRVSATGDGWLYLVAPMAIALADRDVGLHSAVLLLLGFTLERLCYFTLKRGCKRRRPPSAIPGYSSAINASDEFSFPSGHTSGAFLFVTAGCLEYGPVAAIGYLWAAAVGASRIVLGVHFPTDIAMGALMGSSLAMLAANLVGTM